MYWKKNWGKGREKEKPIAHKELKKKSTIFVFLLPLCVPGVLEKKCTFFFAKHLTLAGHFKGGKKLNFHLQQSLKWGKNAQKNC